MSSFFWDGRENRLEAAAIQALTNPAEMDLSGHEKALQRLRQDPTYRPFSQGAFGTPELGIEEVALALTAYLRSLPLHPTRYDLSKATDASKTALTQEQAAGLALFSAKAGCSACHSLEGSPAALTDNRFHHAGIGFGRVAGNINGMIELLDSSKKGGVPTGTLVLGNASVAELGRFAVTRKPADLGAFRTPSLRNVSRTAPYMHDGSVATLADAVERELYYRGLALGRPITLTVEEQQQLLAFLIALNAEGLPVKPNNRGRIQAASSSGVGSTSMSR